MPASHCFGVILVPLGVSESTDRLRPLTYLYVGLEAATAFLKSWSLSDGMDLVGLANTSYMLLHLHVAEHIRKYIPVSQ